MSVYLNRHCKKNKKITIGFIISGWKYKIVFFSLVSIKVYQWTHDLSEFWTVLKLFKTFILFRTFDQWFTSKSNVSQNMFGFCPSTTQWIQIIKACWWLCFLNQLCSATAKTKRAPKGNHRTEFRKPYCTVFIFRRKGKSQPQGFSSIL